MNPLDDLLTAAGRVPDVSPDGLRNGRAALNAARGASTAEAERKPMSWRSGMRAKALIGTAVAAAGAAAAATVIAMPSSSPAGSSAKAPVVPTMAPAPATLTAATVLDQAAQAAGSQPGWPNARYWYSEDQYLCGGQLYTDRDWLSRYGSGVLEKTGPRNNADSLCTEDLFTVPLPYDSTFGPYTWSQLYTLPTDPAELARKLMADFPSSNQEPVFQDVMILLTDTPAPPAVREALFKVAAGIPGVKVTGHYTDALGRTGTALELDWFTTVVDPANGLVLDQTTYDNNRPSTVMYVTEGPATSEPKPVKP
ncbi:MAG TPA: CU044_5270 family protein [Trebonia sp.]